MEAFKEEGKLLIRNKIIEVHHTPADFDHKLCLSIVAVTSKNLNAPASPPPALTATSGAFTAQVRGFASGVFRLLFVHSELHSG